MYYTCDQCHKLIKPEETWCMKIADKNHHLCRDCCDDLEKIKATYPDVGEDYPF